MVFMAVNTLSAIHILVLNGFGPDAFKLSRSIWETQLNIFWLKKHPDDVRDFVDYYAIQRKQWYDLMDDDAKRRISAEQYKEMVNDYEAALPRFKTGRDKTRPRNEWCRVSLYERAKEADQAFLYRTSYRQASSIHHGDIFGMIAGCNPEAQIEMAPDWKYLEETLVDAHGAFIRCLEYFDDIAQLGFKERIGELADNYNAALKAL
ncbi:MAG: DUF5677 domain-containing protein [Bryobacteraceae bacterium]